MNLMNFIKTLFIAILFSGTAYAQTQSSIEDKPFIEVNGVAEQEIIPDQIYISIVIREKYENKEKNHYRKSRRKIESIIKRN